MISYFVHGTTDDNEIGRATGQAQGRLSTIGIEQSKNLPNQIQDKSFKVVFCSDLRRALDSAKLAFKGFFPIIIDKRLRECNYGQLTRTKDELVMYDHHIDTPFPGGESLMDVEKRMREFLDFLLKNYNNKHVAIVAHKATQLALEVIIHRKTWKQAISEDWRLRKAWQPGWIYHYAK